MPLDLGDHSARLRPACRPVGEIGVVPDLVRRPSDWAREQIADPVLKDLIGGQPDRVFDPLGLKALVDPRHELDDALGLTAMAGELLADARTGKNGRHDLIGMLRQSVFGRLAGYEDVNDAERLRHDPAMRWIVGGKAAQGYAASRS